MDLKTYQTIIKETAIYPKEIGLSYCAMGLAGESGEVANKIKKLYRDKEGFIKFGMAILSVSEGKEVKDTIKHELGDVLWYITALANEIDLSLEDIMKANYDKLMKRKEENTLSGSGDYR